MSARTLQRAFAAVTTMTRRERARKARTRAAVRLPCRRRARSLVLATRDGEDSRKGISYTRGGEMGTEGPKAAGPEGWLGPAAFPSGSGGGSLAQATKRRVQTNQAQLLVLVTASGWAF